MDTQKLTPNRPTVQDASAVAGILVEISGDLGEGGLEDESRPDLAARMQWSLEAAELVPPDADEPVLALALYNLSQRMLYVLGEYESPPEPDIGLATHDVWFWSLRSRDAFLREVQPLGLRCTTWRRWLRARVIVATTELLESDQFHRRVSQIEETARRHRGHYRGWSGPGSHLAR